eukprot:g15052.t1
MNSSYKIVLLGAFVVFAAVVGYYVLSGGNSTEENQLKDDYAQQDPAPEPSAQTVEEPAELEDTPEPRPVLEELPDSVEPIVEEQTIGESPDELPEAPVIASGEAEGEPLVRADPQGDDPAYAETGLTDGPASEDPVLPREEATEPGDEPRPGPGLDPDEATQEPEAEPEADPDPRPVPPAPGSIPRTYTVQSGDTFASIAEAFYNDESAWYDIAQANPSVDPKRLQIGQVIVLPDRDGAVREREEVQPPAPGKDQSYTVRPGDNLSKIAQKFYGDAEKWDLIYARNRQLIGSRPNNLKVGMELVIPQAYEATGKAVRNLLATTEGPMILVAAWYDGETILDIIRKEGRQRECILLPHATVPLHIFEPRYRAMTKDALDSDGLIAMATFEGDNYQHDYEGNPPIRPAVCVGYIVHHDRLYDGRYNILLQGIARATVQEEQDVSEDNVRSALLRPTEASVMELDLEDQRRNLDELINDKQLQQLRSIRHIRSWFSPDLSTPVIVDLAWQAVSQDSDQRYASLAEPCVFERFSRLKQHLLRTRQTLAKASTMGPCTSDTGLPLN